MSQGRAMQYLNEKGMAVIFSPSRGFWNDSSGWETIPAMATKIPTPNKVQLSFKSRDVKLIPLNCVTTLTTPFIFNWLRDFSDVKADKLNVPLCFFISENTDYDAFYDVRLDIYSLVSKLESIEIEKAPLIPPFLGWGPLNKFKNRKSRNKSPLKN